MKEYEQGKVKVVWIQKDKPEHIFSKMFDDEKQASTFAATKPDSLVFRLVTQQYMETFEWELLPYGRYEVYRHLFRTYRKHQGSVTVFLKLLR